MLDYTALGYDCRSVGIDDLLWAIGRSGIDTSRFIKAGNCLYYQPFAIVEEQFADALDRVPFLTLLLLEHKPGQKSVDLVQDLVRTLDFYVDNRSRAEDLVEPDSLGGLVEWDETFGHLRKILHQIRQNVPCIYRELVELDFFEAEAAARIFPQLPDAEDASERIHDEHIGIRFLREALTEVGSKAATAILTLPENQANEELVAIAETSLAAASMNICEDMKLLKWMSDCRDRFAYIIRAVIKTRMATPDAHGVKVVNQLMDLEELQNAAADTVAGWAYFPLIHTLSKLREALETAVVAERLEPSKIGA